MPRPVLLASAAVALVGGVVVGVGIGRSGHDSPTKVSAGKPRITTTTTTPATTGDPTTTFRLGADPPPVLGTATPASTPGSVPGTTTSTSMPLATSTTTITTAVLTATGPTYPTGPADPLEMERVYVVGAGVGDGVPHRVAAGTNLRDRAIWAADGRRLLYTLGGTGTYSRASDGVNGHLLLGASGIETPDWSVAGDLAVIDYVSTGSYDLLLVAADGTTRRIAQADVGAVSGRAWSPDGTRIAFVADGRIWVAEADAGDVHAITPAGGKAWRWLKWSPDGTRIAYYEAERLVVVDADGANRHDVAPANGDPTFDWSPDGTQLAVAGPYSSVPKYDIGIVSAAGGPVRSLGVQGIELSWSPDGGTIAYKAWPLVNGALAVGLIHPDGTGKRTLLSPPTGIFFGLGLDWSPDSSHLLVNTGSAGDGGPAEPV